MQRKWIPVKLIDPWDAMHKPLADGFEVDAEKDGQTTAEHREGIDFIKGVLTAGQKIRPILVADDGYGTYERLDGFKRYWAHLEQGEKYIEAFVCTPEERTGEREFEYGSGKIRCGKGGLPKEDFGLFEGGERPNWNYDDVIFLFKSPNGAGLRIELGEAIHVHWGEVGRHRLLLGRRDFEVLAGAIERI